MTRIHRVTPRYRLTSALARLRAFGVVDAWRLLPGWWSPDLLRSRSAEALVCEVLGDLAAVLGVSSIALYQPGTPLSFLVPPRWTSRTRCTFSRNPSSL